MKAWQEAAGKPTWCSIKNIDVSLYQHSISCVIDVASYSASLSGVSNPRSKALALSSAICHAGDCLIVVTTSYDLCLTKEGHNKYSFFCGQFSVLVTVFFYLWMCYAFCLFAICILFLHSCLPCLPYITQCGSTVYIGIDQVTQHQSCTFHLKIQVFTFTRHFISHLRR